MTDLTTKTARKRLKPLASGYAQVLATGRALIYRRRTPATPGRWVLRTARAADAGYTFEVLGPADDFAEADGKAILSYAQALAMALGRRAADPNRITVEEALAGWARAKCATASGEKQRLDIDSSARRIAAAFPRRTLRSLDARDIGDWMRGIVDEGADARARRATANRRLAILKAACTKAAAESGYEGPRGWEAAKKFGKAESHGARMIILTEAQEEAWIAAARPDVADLLTALRLTGARYGEIRAANVGDLHGTRLALAGKTGRRTITLSADKAAFFQRVAGNHDSGEPLLRRRDGTRWPDGGQLGPVETAAAAAGLPEGTTSYALRHGFISRALARGVPVVAVAQHTGTSVEMIMENYAKFAGDEMAGWFA